MLDLEAKLVKLAVVVAGVIVIATIHDVVW